ncbi:uncharacterized protein TNCV_1050931 [Trichonephila clavipes]|nr:uncharacterized protein TNCV_1050931 [Trichonephila clavipes]
MSNKPCILEYILRPWNDTSCPSNSALYSSLSSPGFQSPNNTIHKTCQHDLASCHTSKLFQTFRKENKITVLDRPCNLPALNPIGKLWHILKNDLAKKNWIATEQIIKSVMQVWFHIDEIKNMCATLEESIPRRVEKVISATGKHTSC